jgi:hypothetical protein
MSWIEQNIVKKQQRRTHHIVRENPRLVSGNPISDVVNPTSNSQMRSLVVGQNIKMSGMHG